MINASTCLAALALLSTPLVANAQQTTLDYQGDIMTGTSGGSSEGNYFQTGTASGSFDASIVLNGSLSANDLTLTSYSITFNGQAALPGYVSSIQVENPGSTSVIQQTSSTSWSLYTGEYSSNGILDLTTADGAITGATVSYYATGDHEGNYGVSIGSGGDSYSYFEQPCDSSPCVYAMNVSNSTAGSWSVTSAPEIDPASAAGGLTLLLGSLLVLRGRRSVKEGRCVLC